MRIVDIRATPVTVLAEAPWRWSNGIELGTTRTVIELITDEAIVGLGETHGGAGTVRALSIAKEYVLGLDPLELGLIQEKLSPLSRGYAGQVPAYVRAAIEIACLDAAGKALNRSVASLLGGVLRHRVEVAAYLFYRDRSADASKGGESSPSEMLDHAEELVAKHGFRVLKLKGGVLAPYVELETLRLLRARFPDAPLVWDPNAAWSVESTIRIGQQLLSECLDLQYLEDPCADLEGMSRARRALSIPFATNMCVIRPEQLAPGIRMGSVDVVLADIHFWGGFRESQKLAAVCEAFRLGLGLHSDRELGISTAAMVHFAAATPQLSYAMDSHYHDQSGDIIAKPWVYHDGYFELPDGDGLGVEVDADKLAFFHREYLRIGDVDVPHDVR